MDPPLRSAPDVAAGPRRSPIRASPSTIRRVTSARFGLTWPWCVSSTSLPISNCAASPDCSPRFASHAGAVPELYPTTLGPRTLGRFSAILFRPRVVLPVSRAVPQSGRSVCISTRLTGKPESCSGSTVGLGGCLCWRLSHLFRRSPGSVDYQRLAWIAALSGGHPAKENAATREQFRAPTGSMAVRRHKWSFQRQNYEHRRIRTPMMASRWLHLKN